MSVKASVVSNFLNNWAQISWAESYDNVGLLVGEPDTEVNAVLVCLDVSPEVIEEAIERQCQMVVAHHPVIFKGLHKITGAQYTERLVLKAIRHGICIHAIHTNLDNSFFGVNQTLALKLGFKPTQVLRPFRGNLEKLVTYAPVSSTESVLQAMFAAGAGSLGGYKECSFVLEGKGIFLPTANTNPAIGEKGIRNAVAEKRIEVLIRKESTQKVIDALKQAHPYEEVAYDCIPLSNTDLELGSGMLSMLPEPLSENELLAQIKQVLQVPFVKHSPKLNRIVEKVAICGGSGSFLIEDAKASGAQVYITSDLKYHDYFKADNQLLLVDAGHYETEQFTSELIAEKLRSEFDTFAVLLTETNTNPISYG